MRGVGLKARAGVVVSLGVAVCLAGGWIAADQSRARETYLRCGTEEPSLETQASAELRVATANLKLTTVTVKVHWHVINKGTATTDGNLPLSQIQDQMKVMNDSYGGVTGGAKTIFKFELDSIDRTTNENWYLNCDQADVAQQMKAALHEGGARELNVYSARPNVGLLGRSTFPWSYAGAPDQDGVILRYSTVPGGVAAPFNLGDTLVHETGHWLGLYHTFQGKCSNKNDYVADTPAEKYPASGNPVGLDTCQAEGLDPVWDFMDYSDDIAMYKFTPGQATRMALAWAAYRV